MKKKYDRSKYKDIYGSWYSMKQRCGNPNNHSYKNYGGRGITYPKKWELFAGFKEDLEITYKKGLFLDRIDNNAGYSKENCRWTTRKINNRNKRRHILVNYQGKKILLSEYIDLIGLNVGTIRSRYYRGMSMKEIMKPTLYRPAKV